MQVIINVNSLVKKYDRYLPLNTVGKEQMTLTAAGEFVPLLGRRLPAWRKRR